MSARARATIERYFAECDVVIDGPRPTDIQIRDPRFYRMWRYYLSSVAAGFRSRNADVWQALLSNA